MKNLVTGATGLVGSYLCRYLLLKGMQVRAIKRADSDLSLVDDIKNNIEWIEGDVLDISSLEDALQNIDHVYHAAGFISYSSSSRKKLLNINAKGTANIVNCCLESGIKKLLYISSSSALGKNRETKVCDEKELWEKNKYTTDYALSKFLAEREVWRGIAEGLNATILNPTIIVGPGDWQKGSSKLFSTVFNGYRFYTEGITGYVDVRDIVEIAYTLMQSEITGEKYVLSSENISFKDYLFMIADALHKKRPSIKAGKFLSSLAWHFDTLAHAFTGKEPAITKATAHIANSIAYYNNEKIRHEIGFQFRPIKQSIEDTAEVFLLFHETGKRKFLAFDK